VVKLLSQQQLKQAIDGQAQAAGDLAALLELLLSENRQDRLKSEQARVRDYVKEVERLIRRQKSLQGRNEGGAETRRLAGEQGELADRTDQLADKIQQNEEGGRKPGDDAQKSEPDQQNDKQTKRAADTDKGKDRPGNAKKDARDKGAPSGKQERKGNQQEAAKGKNDPSSQAGGKQGSQDDSQGGGKSGGAKDSPQENPARQRVQAAEQKMRQAQKKLEQAERKASIDDQQRAKEELEKAKAELEHILRQLREEEIQRMLTLLEDRFRKMLDMQRKVYESTTQLDAQTPEQERDNTILIRAGRLAFEQRKIALEADKAYDLLLEEGSSVAFPETVDQMREAMRQAADRLADGKTGAVTQGIQEEIIAALEELIQALQQEQRDLEKQQQSQTPPAEAQDQPLVDQLAEIKMIRALQMRVNTRTQRYAKLLDDINDPTGRAADPGLQDALRKLADREARIQKIAREIVLGAGR
jgi:hypothetical protein